MPPPGLFASVLTDRSPDRLSKVFRARLEFPGLRKVGQFFSLLQVVDTRVIHLSYQDITKVRRCVLHDVV